VAIERITSVLPYDDSYQELRTIFDDSTLTIGGALYAPGSHRVTSGVMELAGSGPATLTVNTDVQELMELLELNGISPHDVELSVVTSSQFMNLVHIVERKLLADVDAWPIVMSLHDGEDEGREPLRACRSGFTVRVLLTLVHEREVDPSQLVPHRRHAILAQSTYRVLGPLETSDGLRIHRLDDERRKLKQVPKNTLVFVEQSESPLECSVLTDSITVYLDSKAMDNLQAMPGRPISDLYRSMIKQAIFTEIALRSVADLSVKRDADGELPPFSEYKNSLLGKLLRMVAQGGAAQTGPRKDAQALYDELGANPGHFLARVQAACRLRERAVNAFEIEDEGVS